jgi:hypothetical protein
MIPELTQVPIALAVSAAAAYLLARGTLGEAGKDAYAALKARIVALLSKSDEIDKLEAKPDSDGRQITLAEELADAGAGDDAELKRLAEALRAEIERADTAGAVVFEDVDAKGRIIAERIKARGNTAIFKNVKAEGGITARDIDADSGGK